MRKNKQIYTMVITALFSALAFVGTMIHIPLPSGGIVHLGNFIMILAGLLCGGLVGGFSGSIGMGLYDIFGGYPPSTYIRTFLLKFLVGFLVGFIFKLCIQKKFKITVIQYIFCGIFLSLAILGSIMLAYVEEGSFIVKAFGVTKSIHQADLIMAVIFAYLFFIGLLVTIVLSSKLKYALKCVVFVTTFVMLINMILELVLRIFFTHVIDGVTLATAYTTAIAKIPASILTAFITMIFIIFLFKPIYMATKNLNRLSDDLDI